MSLSAPLLSLTVAEYLESEKISPMRREYLAGQVFGMGGTSATHNLIAGNVFARLRAHLRGRPWRVFISDMKVRIDAVDFFYFTVVLVTRVPVASEEFFNTWT